MTSRAGMPTFVRYWLYQLPGTALAAIALAWASEAGWISASWAVALLALWIVKDAAFYPLTRDAYRVGDARHGPRAGQLATVRKPLEPRGTVLLDGVLWNAVAPGGSRVESGAAVRVVECRGLVLVVAPAADRRQTDVTARHLPLVILAGTALLAPCRLSAGGDSSAAPTASSARPAPTANSATPAPTAAPLHFDIVERYPHDAAAFTQGLLVDGPTLYESTGLRGRSSVRIVDLATGQVRHQVDLPPQLFGEGLAKVGERLVQLTWTSGIARVYQLPDLRLVGEHRYQGQGWGLCFDGRQLVMSDGSHRLQFRDAASFALTGSVEVRNGGAPVGHLNELECVGDRVYANVWGTWQIVRIDPASGRVDGIIDASNLLSVMEAEALADGAVLNGIAFDAASDTLLLTGKLWPRVHRIRLRAPQ